MSGFQQVGPNPALEIVQALRGIADEHRMMTNESAKRERRLLVVSVWILAVALLTFGAALTTLVLR